MNDTMVRETDWSAIDYGALGLVAPSAETITAQALRACCCGSEQMRFMSSQLRTHLYEEGLYGSRRALAARGFQSKGLIPEYFPLAYDDFILNVTTSHPQMLDLLGRLLEGRYLLDHCLMLNRTPGSRGRRWHAHSYRQGQHEVEENTGNIRPLTRAFLPRQCIRTLCYPEGMGVADGGGELAVIPGAHLYRLPYKWDSDRTDYDETMQEGWMRDKIHAFTGAPLSIRHLSLPPGSMVSFVHHMPHHVGHRDAEAPTRWGLLMAYRSIDPQTQPARWNEGTPAHWATRLEAVGHMTYAMRRVFESDLPL